MINKILVQKKEEARKELTAMLTQADGPVLTPAWSDNLIDSTAHAVREADAMIVEDTIRIHRQLAEEIVLNKGEDNPHEFVVEILTILKAHLTDTGV